MPTIHVKHRLRPTRFAFLVRGNDSKKIAEVFKINTCLWGGMFNPIIPIYKRTPQWWSRDVKCKESPSDFLNRYLDFFEPDFLVECEEGLALNCGFDQRRIIKLE
ncbi:hypothetical protein [Aliivibrio sifiae]|uniref:hypothetical protein n=1 Tax=Aliivibrio sifiae TaxID=566293 RepID=UPI003D09EA16